MGARREITAAVVDRYRSAGRADKGLILDELYAVTGWHRKHAVRALAIHVAISPEARRQRRPTYGATIRDALVALWEASDRICGKRLRVMIPTLLPSLERHGQLKLDQADRLLVLGVSAATIDRLLVETKIAAAGGKPAFDLCLISIARLHCSPSFLRSIAGCASAVTSIGLLVS
jgi:hypothetical protein